LKYNSVLFYVKGKKGISFVGQKKLDEDLCKKARLKTETFLIGTREELGTLE